MHFFLLPGLSIQALRSFAYSLADSVQNNLGIVTDVIRKMIKQDSFRDAHSPNPLLRSNADTEFPLRVSNFLSRGATANDDFHTQL